MSYVPHNVPVYLAAQSGALAGFYAAQFNAPTYYASLANQWAQAVDTAWGAGAFTCNELSEIRTCSMIRWQNQPTQVSGEETAAAYATVAQELVALVRAGDAAIVAEGIDPNGCGDADVSVADLAFVDVVSAYGVDNTGAADAGPALAAAFAVLALTGQIAWLPKGTYKITTAAPPAVGQPVWVGGTGNVTFTGANAASVANVALVYGQTLGQASYNPSWYALGDIYLDPVAGVDNATGMVGAPVKTYAEIARRWGSTSPIITKTTTLHVLSSQAIGVDPAVLEPVLLGPINFIVQGVLAVVEADFVPGARTAKARGTPGQLLTITHAGLTPGLIVHNKTRGSRAIVDSVVGAVATMTQPMADADLSTVTPVPAFVEDDGWTAANHYESLARPVLNLKICNPKGGDQDVAFTQGTFFVSDVMIPDVTGSPGGSQFTPVGEGCALMFMECWIDPFFTLDGSLTVTRPWAGGCWLNGGATIQHQAAIVGGAVGTTSGYGLAMRDGSALDGDVIIHGASDFSGLIGCAYVDGAIALGHINSAPIVLDNVALCTDTGTQCQLWGPGSLNAGEACGSVIQNATGGTWAACLTLSALTIDGVGTGSSFNPVAAGNPYTAGIAVTSANLDANNGLQNPFTGSCFATA